jgi:hypothetical protein
MVMISNEARSLIQPHGKTIRRIRQRGVPFDVPIFLPLINPFVGKRVLFKTQYRLAGVSLEDVREGVMFGDFRSFLDIGIEEFNRKTRTRHFTENPFTKKFEETLGGLFGRAGVWIGHQVAAVIVWALGMVEWQMSEDAMTNPDLASIRVHVSAGCFRGHFKIRVQRESDGVLLTDDWLPEGGGDVRTPTFPMAVLMLKTHPMGIEQIAERVVEEIVQARNAGKPYVGQIGPPSEELN